MSAMLSTPLPTVAQVLEIPATTEMAVPPEFLDENQHMNIQYYLRLGARALGSRCDSIGMGQAYIDERRLTVFTAEQHLRYLHEIRLGETLSVHVRLLERSDKAIHAMAFLLNRSAETLAYTLETTLIHVGMDSRRPTIFPPDIADNLDAAIKEQCDIAWPAPLCGAMGIRRT